MVYQVLFPDLLLALADAARKSTVIETFFLDAAGAYGLDNQTRSNNELVANTVTLLQEEFDFAVQRQLEQREENLRQQNEKNDLPSLCVPERPRQIDCVPLSVLRALATVRGQSLRALLAEIHRGSFQHSSETPPTSVLRLAVAPTIVPYNPHRAAMRARIKKIEKSVANEEYNRHVPARARVAVDLKLGGRGSGRHRELRGPSDGTETMSTFARDISIGLDMRLMSAAGSVVGYYMCWARGSSKEICFVGAAAGAIAMLLMDAILLIVRMAKDDGHGSMLADPEPIAAALAEDVEKVNAKARKILENDTESQASPRGKSSPNGGKETSKSKSSPVASTKKRK